MFETPNDLRELTELLDRSYARAGDHLRSIFTPERRIAAGELVALLPGVQVLNLATVTRACAPRVAPVDGLFYRGQFWFGSAAASVRFTHLRERPQVSATHTRGEELAIIVHGTATLIERAIPPTPGSPTTTARSMALAGTSGISPSNSPASMHPVSTRIAPFTTSVLPDVSDGR